MISVPTLDQIADNPELVRDLPREVLAALAERAAIAHHRLTMAMYAAAMTAPGVAGEREELIGVAELAKLFNVSTSTIQHKAKRTLPYSAFLVPNTRPMMFSLTKVNRYIKQHAGQQLRQGGAR